MMVIYVAHDSSLRQELGVCNLTWLAHSTSAILISISKDNSELALVQDFQIYPV